MRSSNFIAGELILLMLDIKNGAVRDVMRDAAKRLLEHRNEIETLKARVAELQAEAPHA